MIVRGDEAWRATEAADLREFLEHVTAGGYPATSFVFAKCPCGSEEFRLRVDDEQGWARRSCPKCWRWRWMLGCWWLSPFVSPDSLRCNCEGDCFNLAVGFSHRADGSVKWVTVGARCTRCGELLSPVDWKVSSAGTKLPEQV